MCLIPDADILTHPSSVYEFHLRFRFDKSQRNFVIKKFRRGESFLCPIEASISIVTRAHILHVPPDEPIGVFAFAKAKSGFTFLQSSDIIKVMRQVCVAAYPNPLHYMRQHIAGICSHSNRVTAAVVLRAMGLEIPAIAARLRWQPESVDHYLRECDSMIEAFTNAAFTGIHHLN